MITAEPRKPCNLCGIKPEFYRSGGYMGLESKVLLADGGSTTLHFGIDASRTFFIQAIGEDEGDRYYPKFCPECGRRLR